MTVRPRLRGDRRGRITPVDVIFFAATMTALGFLIAPMYSALNANASHLTTPTAYLFQMVPAGLVMTLIIIVWRTAVGRGS